MRTYSAFSRFVHWLTLGLIGGLFALAWSFEDFEQPLRGQLLNLHRSLGVMVLALTAIRLLYRWQSGAPALPPGLARWQVLAGRGAQLLLYALLVLEPALGWSGSSAAGRTISLFGIVDLPSLLSPDRGLARTIFAAHEVVADLLLAVVAAHALAALHHHYVRRDDVLASMLGGR
jgi:cytochrome b561